MISLAVVVLCIGGCASRVSQEQWQARALSFVQDGTTTREQVLMKLGDPTGRYEAHRIFTYRIARVGDDDLRVVGRLGRDAAYAGHNWEPADYSLVLVFGGDGGGGILAKHSLVSVR